MHNPKAHDYVPYGCRIGPNAPTLRSISPCLWPVNQDSKATIAAIWPIITSYGPRNPGPTAYISSNMASHGNRTPTNKLTTDFGKDKPTSRCQTIHLMSAFLRH